MDHRPGDLPCAVVRDLLPLVAESLVAPETEAALSAHLEGCPACRALVRAAADTAERTRAEAGPVPGPLVASPVPALRRLRRTLLWTAGVLVALALLAGGGLALLIVGLRSAPPHVCPSLDLYLKDNLPGYPDALSLGQAAPLRLSRRLATTTRLRLVGYWPTDNGTYLVAELLPAGGAGVLFDPVRARVTMWRGGPSYAVEPEDAHWLAGGRVAMVFMLPKMVGALAPTRHPPLRVSLAVLEVAPLPANTAEPARPLLAGASGAFAAVQGFRPVVLTWRVPASVYQPVVLERVIDPTRYALGRRWLELDALTVTSTGVTVTGRVHLIAGDRWPSVDLLGCLPGQTSCSMGMRDPPSGAGTHPFTLTYQGTVASLPPGGLRLQVAGLQVVRVARLPLALRLAGERGGTVVMRRGRTTVRLVALGPRGATLALTAPAPEPEVVRGPGLWRRLFPLTLYLGQGSTLTALPSVTVDGRQVDLVVTGEETATSPSKGSVSTLSIAWRASLPLAAAAAVVSHGVRVQTVLALPVPGGVAVWPSGRSPARGPGAALPTAP